MSVIGILIALVISIICGITASKVMEKPESFARVFRLLYISIRERIT